jgi:hypothetical protein
MALERHKRAIGVFPNRPATASALQALTDAGFSTHDITVITRDGSEEGSIAGVKVQDAQGNNAESGAKTGAFAGGVLGSVAGALVGIGALTIPGVAPAVVLGEAAAVVVSILAGGAVGAAAGGLVGALIGLGVPRDRAERYSDRVSRGEYLVMLKGSDRSLERAEELLHRYGVGDWGVYDIPERGGHGTDADRYGSGVAPMGYVDRPQNDAYVDPRRGNDYNMVDHPMDRQVLNQADYRSDNRVETHRTDHQPLNDVRYSTHDEVRGYANEPHGDRPMSTPQPFPTHVDDRTPVYPDQAYGTNTSDRLDVPPVVPAVGSTPVDPQQSSFVGSAPVMPSSSVGEKRLIGAFPNQYALERALEALSQSGFPMQRISIVMRDPEAGDHNQGMQGGMAPHSNSMGSMSRFTNFLVGSHRVNVPGIGAMLIVGAEAAEFSHALADKMAGVIPTDVVEGFGKLGVPKAQARVYRDRLMNDGSLVVVRGSGDETLNATSILNQAGIQDWGVYNV